ncbi:helix-turn-helix transcriptional regulator [Microbacterium hatanonis]|uniref:Helix-turn-helix transcriptional regulator n=1 Tax=Microbacterium hatanonis TaxID=404366 RepID=A0A5C8I336_9MICO|nr:helix-turn-helix transcriptional regulator [Microbacterium hatanonis]TXK12345.1 helix-turn-helix transcriptional regulator [Microbacterium hatanonis]
MKARRDRGSVRSQVYSDESWSAFAVGFGLTLQRLRVERGLSQDEMAVLSGVSRNTYQKYEKGRGGPDASANPTLRVLLALAQVLQVGIEDLLPPERPDRLLR